MNLVHLYYAFIKTLNIQNAICKYREVLVSTHTLAIDERKIYTKLKYMYISKEGDYYFSYISYDDTINANMNSLQRIKQCQFYGLYKGQGHISLSGAMNFI